MKIIAYVTMCVVLVLSSCTKKNKETSERFFFRNDGADIAVQVDGNIYSKVFILLLHGGPGGSSSKYNSKYFSDQLEEKYAMVYMDQRGNGASQGSFDELDLTLDQNSKDVYALSKFLKKKYGNDISLFLMGHSWGGMTSTHALIHTDIQTELNGWIKVSGIYDYNKNSIEAYKMLLDLGNQQVAAGNSLDFWNSLLPEIEAIDTTDISASDRSTLNSNGRLAEREIPNVIDDDTYDSSSEFGTFSNPEGSLATLMNNFWSNFLLNEHSSNNPLTDRINEIAIPSQFVWGEYDFIVPPAMGVYSFDHVGTSDKELVILQNSGHFPMKNEPVLFVQEVSDFIEQYK